MQQGEDLYEGDYGQFTTCTVERIEKVISCIERQVERLQFPNLTGSFTNVTSSGSKSVLISRGCRGRRGNQSQRLPSILSRQIFVQFNREQRLELRIQEVHDMKGSLIRQQCVATTLEVEGTKERNST